jgi:hypothetical protein
VSEATSHRLSVLRRSDGRLVTRIGSRGVGDGRLDGVHGLCLMACDRHVAVAEVNNHRVSVFAVDGGAFVRHIGAGVLNSPVDIACTAFDELVVADTGNRCVRVFSDVGEPVMVFGDGNYRGVTLNGATVVLIDFDGQHCVVWS